MGMDFSTGGRRGLPIVSITDGKIVQVQRYWTSIGNAVIVEHKDGVRARYGHLSRFSPKLTEYLKKSSIAKSFRSRRDFDHELTTPIAVKGGEIIAFSGDTGIGPPHLHFELFKDGIYYNPKDYGFTPEDSSEVVFDFICIKPESPRSFINGKHEPLTIPFTKTDGGYSLNSELKEIPIQGLVSVQVSAHQKTERSRLGLQTIQMELNGSRILNLNFSELPKSQTKKFVLVYDSYRSKSNGNPFLYNLFSRDGNGIPGLGKTMIGSGLISSGILNATEENIVSIQARGLGEAFNEAIVRFIKDTNDYSHIQTPSFTYNVRYDRYTNLASSDRGLELFFPTNSIFGRALFHVQERSDIQLALDSGLSLASKIYKVSPDEFREFNLGYDLYMKLNPKIDISRAGLYEILEDGKAKPIKKAHFVSWGRFFKVRMNRTGMFAVLYDSIPPTIELASGLKNGHTFPSSDFEVEWKIHDAGSGFDLNSVQAWIDGIPAIAEVNTAKGYALIVEPEIIYQPGKHKMEVQVTDRSGNTSERKSFEYMVLGATPKPVQNAAPAPTSTQKPAKKQPTQPKISKVKTGTYR
jgi:hypothetical protein